MVHLRPLLVAIVLAVPFLAAGTAAPAPSLAATPPGAPDLHPASDTGTSSTDDVTMLSSVTVSGTASWGSSVELRTSGGASLGTTPVRPMAWWDVAGVPDLQEVGTDGLAVFAFGGDGSVWSSHDAISWSPRTVTPLSIAVTGFAYSATRDVLVAPTSAGGTWISSDGATWGPANDGYGAVDVAWSPSLDRFVKVAGSGGTLLWGSDGRNWTKVVLPTTEGPRAVTWDDANQQFLVGASAGSSGSIWTSTDGKAWTKRLGTGTGIGSIAVSVPDHLIVALSGATAYTSPDGITWTSRALPGSVGDVAYSPVSDTFVAVGTSTGALVSSDGVTWTRYASAGAMSTLIRFEPAGVFVGVGPGALVRTSPDGRTWTDRSLTGSAGRPTSTYLYTIARSSSRDLLVASGQAGSLFTSADGVSWTPRASGTTMDLRAGAYAPYLDLLVMVGQGGTVLTSSDGVSWTPRPSGTTAYLRAIRWVPETGLFIVPGDGGVVLSSPDGITWSAHPTGATQILRGIAYSPADRLYVAVGDAGTIVSSPDLIAWTPRTSGTGSGLRSIAYSPTSDVYVASVSGSGFLSSPDGLVWTGRPSVASTMYALEYMPEDDLLVAVGSQYVATSRDGIAWAATVNPAGSPSAMAVVRDGTGRYVAVGGDGLVEVAHPGWRTTITLPEGTTSIVARATDGSGWSLDSAALAVTVDTSGPRITVDQAAGQADPAPGLPVDFTVQADEPVRGLTADDLILGGTAAPTAVTLSGSSPWTARITGAEGLVGTLRVSVASSVMTDGAGNANTASTTSDDTVTLPPPSADLLAPDEGTSTVLASGSTTVRWVEGGGAVLSRSLQRRSGPVVVPGSCLGVAWADDGAPTTATSPVAVNGMVTDRCYRWVLTLNGSITATSGSLLVDLAAPVLDVDTPAPGTRTGIATDRASVGWTASDAGAGVAAVGLGRQRSALLDAATCDDTAWADDGPAAPATSPVEATGLAPGSCYRWRLAATDGAGNAVEVTTGTLLLPPPSGVFDAPASGATLIDGDGDLPVAWTESGVVLSRSVRHEVASPVDGTCDAATWGDAGDASDAASPLAVSGLAAGCHRWVLALGGSDLATSGPVLVDPADPDADFTSPDEGTTQPSHAGGATVAWTEDGTGTPVVSRSVQRRSGPAVDGACAGVTWTDDGQPVTGPPPIAATGLHADTCYGWALTLVDAAGHTATATSGAVLAMGPAVAFTAPVAPLTVTDWTHRMVSWTETDRSGTGIAGRGLQREQGMIVTPGSCADATWAPDGPPTGVASPHNETPLADGFCYRWSITITDGDGASAQARSGAILVDGGAPLVTVTSPAVPDLLEATAGSVAWTVIDPVSGPGRSRIQRQKATPAAGDCDAATWRNDGSAVYATSPATATLVDGTCYRWVVTASDAAGNTASATSADLLVDLTLKRAPALTVTGHGMARPAKDGPVWLAASGSDVTVAVDAGTSASVVFEALGAGWSPADGDTQAGGTGSRTFAPDAGAPTAELRVHGRVRGRSTPDARLVLAVDGEAPTARFASPLDGIRRRTTSLTVAWDESDAGSGIVSRSLQRQIAATMTDAGRTCSDWSDDGAADDRPSPRTATGLTTGCYRWRLTLVDAVGNTDTFTSGSVWLDTDAPAAAFTGPSAGTLGARIATVSWMVTDALPVRVRITHQKAAPVGGSCAAVTRWNTIPGTAVATASGAADDSGLVPGQCYRWRLVATDLLGNDRTVVSAAVKAGGPGPRADFTMPDEWAGAARATAPANITWKEIATSGRIRSRSVQRERADLEGTGCAAAWTADGGPLSPSRTAVTTGSLPVGACYRWTVTLTDGGATASSTSGVLRLDAAGPGALSLAPERDPRAHLDGSTLWVRTGAPGSLPIDVADGGGSAWLLDLSTSDSRSWKAPDVAMAGSSDGAHGRPVVSWAKGAPRTTLTVRARSGARVPGPDVVFDLRPDNGAPALAIDGVGLTGLDARVRWTTDDAASGLRGVTVARLAAVPASDGACGAATYAPDGPVVLSRDEQRLDVAGLVPGTCYRWRLVATDRVGNASGPVVTDPLWVAAD